MLKLKVSHAGIASKGKNYDDFKIVDEARNIFLVGDGLATHPAPEEASTLALTAAYYFLRNNAVHFENGIVPKEQIPEYIGIAINHANDVLYALSEHLDWFFHQSGPTNKERAGTTLQVCYFLNSCLYIGQVGDGSIYLMRGNELKNLTTESVVEDEGLEKLKALTGEKSVGEYIGKRKIVDPQLKSVDLKNGDIVVMNTDGLDKLLFKDDVKEVLQTTHDFRESACNLINAANHPYKVASYIAQMKGEEPSNVIKNIVGRDAITVITMQVCEE